MTARTLMVQGTASTVGKSVLVAALCRIFKQDGIRVAPFKAQNMALNSFVTREGGEIGRAQAVQAEAAGVEASVDMNPVLLKPEADARSQVIVLGKVAATATAARYYDYTPALLEVVRVSLERLRSAYDVVVIEGAGSPAEINLKEREIANMRVARMAGAPVLLVGDIDRGGVFASVVGTLALLDEEERRYVRGIVINKFRGDVELLKPGLQALEALTSKPVLGVVPYFRDILIAQEDSVYLDERAEAPPAVDLEVAVVRLPHISNYDDFDPLEEEGCRVRYVSGTSELDWPDLIIVPGTKSTIADLRHLWRSGLAEAIVRLANQGTPVVGVCGGYQMLGKSLHDAQGVESGAGAALGLGLLDMVTAFAPDKSTAQVRGKVVHSAGMLRGMRGVEVMGYEIHMGRSVLGQDGGAFHVFETPNGAADYIDGAVNAEGTVLGTYIHGLFHNGGFRRALLNNLRRRRGLPERWDRPVEDRDRQYDRLADHVRRSLDMPAVYRILEEGTTL